MRKANPVSDKAIPTCLLPTSRASRGPPVALTMAANAARLCLQPTSNERSAAARMHCNLRTNIKCDDNAKFLCVLSASNIAKHNGRRSRSAGSRHLCLTATTSASVSFLWHWFWCGELSDTRVILSYTTRDLVAPPVTFQSILANLDTITESPHNSPQLDKNNRRDNLILFVISRFVRGLIRDVCTAVSVQLLARRRIPLFRLDFSLQSAFAVPAMLTSVDEVPSSLLSLASIPTRRLLLSLQNSSVTVERAAVNAQFKIGC
jgi:hypothetical protein